MRKLTPASVIARGWGTILAFGMLGLVVALIFSFLQPLRYSSTVRLLLIQDLGSVDAYTASRSVERLAENLATIVYTTSFFDSVMAAGFDIDEAYFPAQENKRRRAWSKMVSATVTRGSGLLTLSVYHQDVSQAEQIVNAIAYVLSQQASSYISGGKLEVRIVDSALNSHWPARPNIPANGFSGLVLGGLAGVGYLFIQQERVKRRHQLMEEEFG